MNIKELYSAVKEVRTLSEAAWEMAADTARDDASAAEFVEQWDAWGDHWDDAEQAILDGRIGAAIDALELARRLESAAGDDAYAKKASTLCGGAFWGMRSA